MRISEIDEKRFWEKVEIGSDDDCWNWKAAKQPNGYGAFASPISLYAHRIAYTLKRGPIPPGTCVLHHCDNKSCVNPNHLFLGTRADNAKDRVRKGRSAHAFNSNFDILSAARLCYTGKYTSTEIALLYGCRSCTVRYLGKGHRHLPINREALKFGLDNAAEKSRKLASFNRRVFLKSDIWEILERRLAGENLLSIAESYGVTDSAISRICNGNRYAEFSDEFNSINRKEII
jgi:hypothetical protein